MRRARPRLRAVFRLQHGKQRVEVRFLGLFRRLRVALARIGNVGLGMIVGKRHLAGIERRILKDRRLGLIHVRIVRPDLRRHRLGGHRLRQLRLHPHEPGKAHGLAGGRGCADRHRQRQGSGNEAAKEKDVGSHGQSMPRPTSSGQNRKAA